MNVLMTAGSRRVPLVQAFQAALRRRGGGRVIVADVDASSPAVHVADRAFEVPLSEDAGYIDGLLTICADESIGLLVPTVDNELEKIAAASDRFASLGVMVACSPAETASLCNDKFRTCRHLLAHGVQAAQTWLPQFLPQALAEPLFIKPRFGRGGLGAFPIRSRREREFFVDYVDTPVIQEFLQPPEYTIDMLCDGRGMPVAIVPRERMVIRAGVSDRGRTARDERLEHLATQVAQAIPFRGPVNVQCRMRGEQAVVFEINPRFSGGVPLTIAAGADFPAMLLAMAAGEDVTPPVPFQADLCMTRFDASIFVPGRQFQWATRAENHSERPSGPRALDGAKQATPCELNAARQSTPGALHAGKRSTRARKAVA